MDKKFLSTIFQSKGGEGDHLQWLKRVYHIPSNRQLPLDDGPTLAFLIHTLKKSEL
jgi:hypothetical protein